LNFGRRILGISLDTPPVKPGQAVDDLIAQRVWSAGSGPTGGNLCAETAEVRQRYDEIMRSPWVKVGVLSKIWGVAAQDFQCVPYDPDNQRDKDIATFNRDNIVEAKGGLRAIVESLLFGGCKDGYSLCHMKERTAERGRWSGKVMLAVLRPKETGYYDFVSDIYRNVVAIKDLYPEEGQPAILPIDQFIYLRHLQFFDSIYGMSDFRAADQAYCCLDAARKLRMIYLDKYTGPFVEGKYTDRQIASQLLSELREMRAGGVVVYPDGTEIKITEMAASAADAFHQAEADLKEEIVTSITGAFLQMMAGQQSVQRGSSAEHATTAELFRWYLSQLVCDTINDFIIPKFTDMNFAGSPPYPKAVLGGINAADIKADLEIDQMLVEMGVPLSLKDVYRRAARVPPEDEADTLKKQEPPDPFADLEREEGEVPPALRRRAAVASNGELNGDGDE
jgi:hypothetical protein